LRKSKKKQKKNNKINIEVDVAMMYKVIIPGRPVPKGRPRFNRVTGTVYNPKRTKEYEEFVAWCAKQTFKQPLTCELAVYIDVYVKNNVFPDIDNIAKSVLDGMQGVAYENDRQIYSLTIQRIRGKEELVEVRIEPKEEVV